MTLTLNLPPEILDRLIHAAIASGISLEDYATEVLKFSVPEILQPAPPVNRDRTDWIRQGREFRDAIVTTGPALSQTVIESRDGDRY